MIHYDNYGDFSPLDVSIYTNPAISALCVKFPQNSTITKIELVNCTDIPCSYGIYGIKNILELSLPICSRIGSSFAPDARSLMSVYAPNCKIIGQEAFSFCSALENIDFNLCNQIGSSAFYNCTNLKELNFSQCYSAGDYAFPSCRRLSKINLPQCFYLGAMAFASCAALSEINLPQLKSILRSAFQSCSALERADFGYLRTLSDCFSGCTHLSAIYLRSPWLVQLTQSGFSNTPITNSSYLGHFGSIYVPYSLVNQYRSATNWAYYSNRITAIEGSEESPVEESPVEEPSVPI